MLPLALLALGRFVRRPTLWRGGLLGAALWLVGSAGHPQSSFYALLVLCAGWLGLTFLPVRGARRRLLGQLGGGAVAVAVAALLLLPVLGPSRGAVAGSLRSHRGLEYVLQGGLEVPQLREILVPGLDDNWMADLYLGGGGLVLSIFAVAAGRRRRGERFLWAGVGIFGLALALGPRTPVLPALAAHVPGFDLFRLSARHNVIFGFAVALLAGEGLADLQGGTPGSRKRWLFSGLAALWLLFAIVVFFGGLGWAATVEARRAVRAAAIAGGASLALFALASFWPRRRRLAASAALVLGLADLWLAGRSTIEILQPVPDLASDAGLASRLAGAHGEWRYASFGNAPYYLSTVRELRELTGFPNPIALESRDYMEDRAKIFPVLWSRFNVRWWVAAAPPEGIEARPAGPGLFELPDPTPLVRWYGRVEAIPEARQPARLAAPGPIDAALVDPSIQLPAAPSGGAPVDGRLVSLGTNRIVVEVEAPGAGVVVVNELWAPGWRATVNGAETPLYRANAILRAVPVAAGRSTIELRYAPALGLYLCGFAGGLLGLLLLAILRRRVRWIGG